VDAALTFYNLEVELFLDSLSHVQDTLAHDTVKNALIIRRGNQFDVAKAALLDDEQIESSALLDVVVEHPKNIVVAIVLSVTYGRYEGAQVTGQTESSIT